MTIVSSNPYTGERLNSFTAISNHEIELRLQRAVEAFEVQRSTSFAQRAERMRRVAADLSGSSQQYGQMLTREMGKTLKSAIAEVEKCALGCRFYADHAEQMLAPEKVETNAKESFIEHQPLGVVLAVMPWNFPFWQVFRFAAPAIMAGNVALLKHASNVPECALTIETIFRNAGFDEGVFQTLLVGSDAVAEIIADDRVAAVTLTGSEAAGASVASAAGRHLKKAVLELGGSDPFVVMPSADVTRAAEVAATARTINNGQSCIAAKRFIVHRQIAEEFTRHFAAAMSRLHVGDPMDPATEVGPLATPQIADDLDDQVKRTVTMGAKAIVGGARGEGNFYPPTVLVDVPEDSPAATEELFGPVAPIFIANDIDDAIRLANATRYGLGSSVWTTSREERDRFTRDLASGQVFVNAMVASDPHVPFGGVKKSGYGRELGRDGIREFVNIKTVWVEGTSAAGTE